MDTLPPRTSSNWPQTCDRRLWLVDIASMTQSTTYKHKRRAVRTDTRDITDKWMTIIRTSQQEHSLYLKYVRPAVTLKACPHSSDTQDSLQQQRRTGRPTFCTESFSSISLLRSTAKNFGPHRPFLHYTTVYGQTQHFLARSQNCEKRLLASSCPSVRPHGTTRLPTIRILMKRYLSFS